MYELWLRTRGGSYVAGPLVQWRHLEWSMRLDGGIGTLYTLFSAADFRREWFNEFLLAELWYAGGNEPLQLLQRYFVRGYGGGWEDDLRVAWIRGLDLNALLGTRIVTAAAGTTGAQKSGEATAVMVAYLEEALLTDVGRDIAAEMPLTAIAVGNGETISYTASRGQLPSVLSGCAAVSAQRGTPIRYWVAPTQDGAEVRFTAPPYGSDQRAEALSVERNTVEKVQWAYDASDARNYGYFGGGGQKEERLIVTVDASNGTALDRREMWAENSQIKTPAALRAWGEARLWQRRGRKTATARITDREGFRFGRQWRLGDWFSVEDDGYVFQAEVLGVTGTATPGNLRIEAVLRSEE